MENKQTAVEWLINQYFGGIENVTPNFRNHIEQAKQMEKEQIKDAYSNGVVRHLHSKTILSEEYYNEIYGK